MQSQATRTPSLPWPLWPMIAAAMNISPSNSLPHLKLVDKGVISASTIGAMHGEVGQTQFMPKNIFAYGVGGSLTVKENAWHRPQISCAVMAGTVALAISRVSQIFGALQQWNAASVYQQALAIMGKKIDE